MKVDKYTKKLEALILYKLIAIAQVEQLSSLRDICNILSNEELSNRRKIDHESIFRETLRQVLVGEAGYLNDLVSFLSIMASSKLYSQNPEI